MENYAKKGGDERMDYENRMRRGHREGGRAYCC